MARRGDAEVPPSPGRAAARERGRGATIECACAALAILAYLALTLARLDRAGLNYDEVLFVNAALGGYQPELVPLWLGGVRILIHPYLGALKAWLFTPLLLLLPTSVWTIRVPMVLCGAASLLVVRAAVSRLYDRWVALVCIWLLALDPSFLFMTLLDWGPVALSLLLRAIALWLFARWSQRGSGRDLAWLAIVLALGIFDKIHFVWFANAIAVAVVLVRPADARRLVARLGWWAAVIAALTVALAWLGLDWAHSLASDLGNQGFLKPPTIERLVRAGELAAATLHGTGVAGYVVERDEFSLWPTILVLAIVVSSLLGGRAAGVSGRLPQTRALAVATALIFLQLAITAPAIGTHHAISLYPLLQILVAWCAVRSVRRVSEALRKPDAGGATGELAATFARGRVPAAVAGAFSAAALAALLGYDLTRDFAFLSALGGDRFSLAWSPANASLAAEIERDPGHRFVTLDWGLFTQLLTLTGGRASLHESTFSLTDLPDDPARRRWLVRNVLCLEGARFLFHGEGRGIFEAARRNFWTLAREADLPVKRTGLVRDRQGVFAEIYEVSCPKESAPG